jgi:hypothetical protein
MCVSLTRAQLVAQPYRRVSDNVLETACLLILLFLYFASVIVGLTPASTRAEIITQVGFALKMAVVAYALYFGGRALRRNVRRALRAQPRRGAAASTGTRSAGHSAENSNDSSREPSGFLALMAGAKAARPKRKPGAATVTVEAANRDAVIVMDRMSTAGSHVKTVELAQLAASAGAVSGHDQLATSSSLS